MAYFQVRQSSARETHAVEHELQTTSSIHDRDGDSLLAQDEKSLLEAGAAVEADIPAVFGGVPDTPETHQAGRALLERGDLAERARAAGIDSLVVDVFEGILQSLRGFLGETAMLGAICWLFVMFSARIFVTPLWTSAFIPVLSPLYGHGPSWAETSLRTYAILAHCSCGMGMLICATCQFDEHMRKHNRWCHRMSGYLYVIFGIGCLVALRPLRSSTAEVHMCACVSTDTSGFFRRCLDPPISP